MLSLKYFGVIESLFKCIIAYQQLNNSVLLDIHRASKKYISLTAIMCASHVQFCISHVTYVTDDRASSRERVTRKVKTSLTVIVEELPQYPDYLLT
jgi:hypothetical protein